jgi:hypothetical protein
MNAPHREPQAPLDPPANWWGDEEWEAPTYPEADPTMPLQCLAIKVKHMPIPQGVIAVEWYEGKWKVQLEESTFRNLYKAYAMEELAGPAAYRLSVVIAGVAFYCHSSEGGW